MAGYIETEYHRGGTTSASSAFPRSERVYPAIMPLGAISPSDPSWRKASRYDRTAGRQVNTLEGHRLDARTPAADIETISLQKIVRTAALGIRFLRVEGVEPSLATNRIHCQSGEPLKHYNHHFTIRG